MGSKMTPPTGRTTPKGAAAIVTSKVAGKSFCPEQPIPTTAQTQTGTTRTTAMEALPGQCRQLCLPAPYKDLLPIPAAVLHRHMQPPLRR